MNRFTQLTKQLNILGNVLVCVPAAGVENQCQDAKYGAPAKFDSPSPNEVLKI